MKRVFQSGATKRKITKEKKAREQAELTKIPKINELFRAVPSTSGRQIDSESSCSNSNAENALDCDIDVSASHDEGIEKAVDSESRSILDDALEVDDHSDNEDEIDGKFEEFSTDPGLWNVENDIKLLQRYWLLKGRQNHKIV